MKLHRNTPNELYRELGRFFFTPGCLTPSIFNDDSLFFRETVRMATGSDESVYGVMARALEEGGEVTDHPCTVTTFQGARKDPNLRGSITGIGPDNFTPLHFIHGVMHGMAEELFGMYRGYLDRGGNPPPVMIGSGNGLNTCAEFSRTPSAAP